MSLEAPIVDTKLILHRGASAYAPENTLQALHLAAEMDATWLETDVRITSDNELVMIHDEDVDRTTNGSGIVAQTSLEDIRKLDAGGWFSTKFKGVKIPTLSEYLSAALERNLALVLELKEVAGWEERLAYRVCEAVRDTWNGRVQDLVISSFSERCLRVAANDLPQHPRCLALTGLPDNPKERLKESSCHMIHLQHSFARNGDLKMLIDGNIEFALATVNDPAQAAYFLDNGATSVLTDKPDLLRMEGATV